MMHFPSRAKLLFHVTNMKLCFGNLILRFRPMSEAARIELDMMDIGGKRANKKSGRAPEYSSLAPVQAFGPLEPICKPSDWTATSMHKLLKIAIRDARCIDPALFPTPIDVKSFGGVDMDYDDMIPLNFLSRFHGCQDQAET